MFVFVEIGIDGMLGFDFLKDYDCFLDIVIKNKRKMLWFVYGRKN